MSKDMLGPAVRALVGVPQRHYNLIAKIAERLSNDECGDEYASLYRRLLSMDDLHVNIVRLPYDKPRAFTIGGLSRREMLTLARAYRKYQYPEEMIEDRAFPLSSTARTVETIALTLSDLGYRYPVRPCLLPDQETLDKFSESNKGRLKGRRLVLLPAEAGPPIRDQYRDQPKDDLLIIGMELYEYKEYKTGSNRRESRIFVLEHLDWGLKLHALERDYRSVRPSDRILFGLA